MPSPQTYNHHTKCIAPANYSGLYTKSLAFLLLLIGGGVVSIFWLNPGAATLVALLAAIGYCQWWLYGRLVCLGKPNACMVGLVLRIAGQGDQDFEGKLDTDYTLDLLPPPNPLIGATNWYNNMNNPTNPPLGTLMKDQTLPISAAPPGYVAMRHHYAPTSPYGFSAEYVTGNTLQAGDSLSLTSAQTDSLNFLTPPAWRSSYVYNLSDQILDSNGGIETCISPGLSGGATPQWPNPDPGKWEANAGQETADYATLWRYDGPQPAAGILEVEFEGAGVWNLYQALLAALPVASVAAAVCSAGFLGWLACLLLILLTLFIAGVGLVSGLTDNSAENDVNNQVGVLKAGVDVLFVMGTWIWDGGHIPGGWNELHPVTFAQRLRQTVPPPDLLAGDPWKSFPQFSPANLQATMSRMCGLAIIALDPGTRTIQGLPQNEWTLHPLVDGCTPAPGPIVP